MKETILSQLENEAKVREATIAEGDPLNNIYSKVSRRKKSTGFIDTLKKQVSNLIKM